MIEPPVIRRGRFVMAALTVSFLLLAATSMARSSYADSDFAKTAWLADDIGGRGVVDRARSTLQFTEPGKVGGSTGCNRFFGPVELTGDRISFGNLAVTRRACPDALMAQEQRYLEALSKARRLELAHEGLILLVYGDGSEPVLRFSRMIEK